MAKNKSSERKLPFWADAHKKKFDISEHTFLLESFEDYKKSNFYDVKSLKDIDDILNEQATIFDHLRRLENIEKKQPFRRTKNFFKGLKQLRLLSKLNYFFASCFNFLIFLCLWTLAIIIFILNGGLDYFPEIKKFHGWFSQKLYTPYPAPEVVKTDFNELNEEIKEQPLNNKFNSLHDKPAVQDNKLNDNFEIPGNKPDINFISISNEPLVKEKQII